MCSLVLSVTCYETYIPNINKTITFTAPDVLFIHVLEVTAGSSAEHGEKDEWERSEKRENAREMHIITRLVWEIRSAPTSFFFLPWTTLLPSVCIGRKETDEGFTVGSWHVHIPGVVFLPSAPWPYQRPLKQQAVRLWQLASNSSYSSLAPRFPASPSSWAIVCVCVYISVCEDKCVSGCLCV